MYIESLDNDDYSDADGTDQSFLGRFRNSFLELQTAFLFQRPKRKQKDSQSMIDAKLGCRELLTYYMQQKTPLPELIYALRIVKRSKLDEEYIDLQIVQHKKFYLFLVTEDVLLNLGIDMNYQFQLDSNTSYESFEYLLGDILAELHEMQWLQALSQPKIIQAVLDMSLEYIMYMRERVQVILQDPDVIEFIAQLKLLLDTKECSKGVVYSDVVLEAYKTLTKMVDCMKNPTKLEEQQSELFKIKCETIKQRKKRKQNREYKYSLEINFWKQRSKIPVYYIYVHKIPTPEIIYSIKIDRPERSTFPNKIKLRLYCTEKTVESLYTHPKTIQFMESFYMKGVTENQTLKYLNRHKAQQYFDEERVDDIYATNLINGCLDTIIEYCLKKDTEILDRLYDCMTSPHGGFLYVKLHHLLEQSDLSPRNIVEDVTIRVDRLKDIISQYKRSVPQQLNAEDYVAVVKME